MAVCFSITEVWLEPEGWNGPGPAAYRSLDTMTAVEVWDGNVTSDAEVLVVGNVRDSSSYLLPSTVSVPYAVADPGFSQGGGGAPTPKIAIIFQIFAENCIKKKEFGPPGGARPWCLPLGSANDTFFPLLFVLSSLAIRSGFWGNLKTLQ